MQVACFFTLAKSLSPPLNQTLRPLPQGRKGGDTVADWTREPAPLSCFQAWSELGSKIREEPSGCTGGTPSFNVVGGNAFFWVMSSIHPQGKLQAARCDHGRHVSVRCWRFSWVLRRSPGGWGVMSWSSPILHSSPADSGEATWHRGNDVDFRARHGFEFLISSL